ncbi:MAG: hypothetical protein J2P17_11730, partial [Mycobacterium sp.]|nr:hypothetical protein [Mycobacterium sp.]
GAMMHTAQAIQRAAVATESPGIKRIHARIDQGRLTAEQITVAATPMPACEPEDVPETTLRIGWREVLHREDWLAFECVNILHAKNGGKNLPHAYTIEIEHTAAGEEFLARLEPTPRRAEFAILDPDRTATPMFDPLTDTPVIINRSDARILALAPERLPATSPLAEIILDNTIWVRTQDGTLYPAPRNSTYGLSWGYGGGGPRTLAALIVQLLDDITAPGAKPNTDEPLPHDLLRLLEHKWPNGTVLTRARLETACNGSR